MFKRIALAAGDGVAERVWTVLVSTAAGLAVQLALASVSGASPTYAILILAALVATLRAGRGAGMATAVLCLVGNLALAQWAPGLVVFDPLSHAVLGLAYLVVAGAAILVGAGLRTSIRTSRAQGQQLAATRAAADESDIRFRLIADNIPNLAWMAEPDGAIYWYNQRWYDYTGTTIEQMQGWGWQDVHDPALVDGITERFKQAIATGKPWEDTFPLRSASGEWRWFLSRARPVRDGAGHITRWFGTNTDITEQRAAQIALAESDARFRLMADTTPAPVWMTNADAEVEFVNASLVEHYGRPAAEILGHVWKQAVHPEDQATVEAAMAAARPEHRPYGFEARFLHADKRWRWMRVSVNPRFDGDGVFLGYVGMAFDITESHETNARLAAAAAERDAILGQLVEGVIVTDPQGLITFVNEAAIRHHGVEHLYVTPEDYTETYCLFTEAGDPYPTEDLPLARAALLGETVTDARWRIRRPDGTEVIAAGNARPVYGPDDTRIGAVLTLRDETARVQAENRLMESETRFRMVADSAPAMIWMLDAEGRPSFANRRYRDFFGSESETGAGDDWLRMLHPDDEGAFSAAFRSAIEGRQRFEGVIRVRHPLLGDRWLRCEGLTRYDSAGEFQGHVGANIDVTEAKRAEEDLKRINELLEERVGEALAEKARAEADLMHAQRMEAVGRLTGGVAHDFNNLLTVVIGALDIILRSPDDAAKRQKLGEAALAAARRGEGLTHQLLAFSRRQALRPQPLDINAQLRESEPLLRRAVGEAVEFRLKLRRGGARVSVDPSQLEAALLNLVVNARDALGAAGKITIQTLSCSVDAGEVTDLAPGDYVCVKVSDNGSGMPPEVIARVFEPFYTTKAVGKGTGLGLSQVYGFARQSGGAAQIASTVGQGTEIRLYLPPLADDANTGVDGPAAPLPALVAGHRLLLVEDDASVAFVALQLLEAMGLEVRTVETGPAALELLNDERFDVMLSDVVMPGGMTGIELARECERRYPDMRIVLTSGYAGDDVDAALTDAPWPFLRKPYTGEQLAGVLGDLSGPAAAADGERR